MGHCKRTHHQQDGDCERKPNNGHESADCERKRREEEDGEEGEGPSPEGAQESEIHQRHQWRDRRPEWKLRPSTKAGRRERNQWWPATNECYLGWIHSTAIKRHCRHTKYSG